MSQNPFFNTAASPGYVNHNFQPQPFYNQPLGTPAPNSLTYPAPPSQMDHHHKMHFCNKYKNYLVVIDMNDGQQYDGIVDRVDDQNVYMLIPDGDNNDERYPFEGAFGGYGGGYGYGNGYDGGYGGGYGYGNSYGDGYGYDGGYGGGYGGRDRYPRRFRRFRRYRFPFARISRLLLYPYFY